MTIDRLAQVARDREAELGPHEALADRVLSAWDARSSISPISDTEEGFDLAAAYRVAAAVAQKRKARGETPVGWKIGFTNRIIWEEYGVYAPIWGPIYDTTVQGLAEDGAAECALQPFLEPRIEPEIAFRLARAPSAEMDEMALLDCIDAVSHGFEIVQSPFAGWRFTPADTVAAFALHGALFHGPWTPVEAADRTRWFDMLSSFKVTLYRNGEEVERGSAENVLGGPLSALRHFVEGYAENPFQGSLKSGDIVTTGTLTRAFPVAAGEAWSTQVSGLPLPGIKLTFR